MQWEVIAVASVPILSVIAALAVMVWADYQATPKYPWCNDGKKKAPGTDKGTEGSL